MVGTGRHRHGGEKKRAAEAASDLDLDSGSNSGREESSGASGFSGAEWSGED